VKTVRDLGENASPMNLTENAMIEKSEVLTVQEPAPVARSPVMSEPSVRESPRTGRIGSVVRWLLGSIPTALVLAALAGLAWWGHHTDWKLPTFAAIAGEQPAEKADWCEEHSVPESMCVECNPKLMPAGKDYGWCTEHGTHQCPLCHPELAQVAKPPAISPAERERVSRALALRERPKNNEKCPLYRRRIQFASAEAMEKAGVDIALVERANERPEAVVLGPLTEAVSGPAEIVYDATRVAPLSSRAPGTVWQVRKQVGDSVRAGEILTLVDAAEVGRAKAEFLQGLARTALKKKVADGLIAARGSVSERAIQEAESALEEARVRLLAARQALVNLGLPVAIEDFQGLPAEAMAARTQFLGLPANLVRQLDPKTTTANLLPVRAPLDGIVVERKTVAGEVVDTRQVLFVVADTRTMWLNLDVRQEEIRYVRSGLPVRFRSTGDGLEAAGKVTWISTAADEKTRTVKVRANLDNPEGHLRAGAFGIGRVILREDPKALVIPSEALHWDGSCNVVFVRDKHFFEKEAPKVFHTRTVRPGVTEGKYTEIIAGLLPGEVVASKGSGILRSELLKNNLGAG
jgi:membrane fusion protein, heavy metal efflux system